MFVEDFPIYMFNYSTNRVEGGIGSSLRRISSSSHTSVRGVTRQTEANKPPPGTKYIFWEFVFINFDYRIGVNDGYEKIYKKSCTCLDACSRHVGG